MILWAGLMESFTYQYWQMSWNLFASWLHLNQKRQLSHQSVLIVILRLKKKKNSQVLVYSNREATQSQIWKPQNSTGVRRRTPSFCEAPTLPNGRLCPPQPIWQKIIWWCDYLFISLCSLSFVENTGNTVHEWLDHKGEFSSCSTGYFFFPNEFSCCCCMCT